MSGEAQITFVGNLTADPELRFTPQGVAVANFTVAVTGRRKVGDQWEDGDASFYRCTVWRQQAENVAESLPKGSRVVVTGTLTLRPFETNDGRKGISPDVLVDSVGPDLRFATATVHRVQRGQQQSSGGGFGGGRPVGTGGQPQGGFGGQPQAQPSDDPWATTASGYSDEPPF